MTVNADILTKMILNAMEMKTYGSNQETVSMDIPVGISNRHIHLSYHDLFLCFGEGYELQHMKDLSQPGQYAGKETVTICGPKGVIEKVRVLGPVRKQTQVEVLAGDCVKLGIKPFIRLSGELAGSAPITVIGPKGSIYLKEGAIVAQRHIHMTPHDASCHQVEDRQVVSIRLNGERGGTYENVAIRVTDQSELECHLDVEEANAMNLNAASKAVIVK
jgi:propanediol utilization protein